MEIINDYETDTFRAVYATKFGIEIYVLHALKKKSKRGIKTPKEEIKMIRQRLKRAQEIDKSKNKKDQ